METIEPFSMRQQKLEGKFPTFYNYEEIPDDLRKKIVFILRGFIAEHQITILEYLNETLGWFTVDEYENCYEFNEGCYGFLTDLLYTEKDIHEFMNVLDAMVRHIQEKSEKCESDRDNFHSVICKINQLFDFHMVGFQYLYESKKIVIRDSELVHKKVVVPALKLLHQLEFASAEQDYIHAYEQFNNRNNKDAILNAAKSIESTLKIIFEKRNWKYDAKKDTAKSLLDTAFRDKLFPISMKYEFAGIRTIIEGIFAIRNRLSGHGTSKPIDVPNHLTTFVLHETAGCILFLVEAYMKLGKKN